MKTEKLESTPLFPSTVADTRKIELCLTNPRYELYILVIAGDQWLRNTLRLNYLPQYGYGFGLTSDFSSGLKALRENMFDVVVIDDKVEGISTEDLALQIKEINPEAALILCREGAPVETVLDNVDAVLNEPKKHA